MPLLLAPPHQYHCSRHSKVPVCAFVPSHSRPSLLALGPSDRSGEPGAAHHCSLFTIAVIYTCPSKKNADTAMRGPSAADGESGEGIAGSVVESLRQTKVRIKMTKKIMDLCGCQAGE